MCKDVSNVVSSSEGSGGRHPGESVPLELPGSGELGVGESDSEGGSVEGDVGDEDGRVGGRTGGLWVAARPRFWPYSSPFLRLGVLRLGG